MKKIIILVFCLIGNIAMAEDYVTKTEFNKIADDVYDLHNDQLLLHLQQQKEIEQIKKGMQDISNLQYDDAEIVKQIDTIKDTQDKLQGDIQNNTKLLNSMKSDFDTFKSETRSGIASAIAIGGLDKPSYDPNHKASVMIGTGTYKGTTKVAYGITYQPNYNMVFSIKGSDDAVATSVGFSL